MHIDARHKYARLAYLNDHIEQLRFKALLLDRKIDNHDLGGDLGCVVRVRELGRDVQLEVKVVVNLLRNMPAGEGGGAVRSRVSSVPSVHVEYDILHDMLDLTSHILVCLHIG